MTPAIPPPTITTTGPLDAISSHTRESHCTVQKTGAKKAGRKVGKRRDVDSTRLSDH